MSINPTTNGPKPPEDCTDDYYGDWIHVRVLQRAHKRAAIDYNEAARRCGYWSAGRADGTAFARQIGIKPSCRRHGQEYRKWATYDRAVQIVRALGFDPVDYNL